VVVAFSTASSATQPDGSIDRAARVALASDRDLVQALASAAESASAHEDGEPAGESA